MVSKISPLRVDFLIVLYFLCPGTVQVLQFRVRSISLVWRRSSTTQHYLGFSRLINRIELTPAPTGDLKFLWGSRFRASHRHSWACVVPTVLHVAYFSSVKSPLLATFVTEIPARRDIYDGILKNFNFFARDPAIVPTDSDKGPLD